MNATTKISVDLLRPNIGTVVNAIQGDGPVRRVRVILLADGKPWEPPEDVETAVSYLQPTMHKGLYNLLEDGTPAISVTGNAAEVILAPQMLTQRGTVRVALVFNDPMLNRLTSFPFTVWVEGNPELIDQPTENYIRLQWLEDKLEQWLSKAEDALRDKAADTICLNDAVITATGDSITAQERNYVKLIAETFGMTYENAARGGATIASGIYNVDGSKRPCICDTIDAMRQDADIVLLSGGVNDQVELNHNLEALGALTEGFDKTLNKATLYGALEYMLRQAVFKWSNKTILYVLPHRMTKNLDYRDAVIAACEKYGVPVVDLMESTPDFYHLSEFQVQYTKDGDGWHPNEEGFRTFYVPQVLSAIRKHFRGKADTVTLPDNHMPEVICVNTSIPSEDIYTPDIAGFIRMNGTISASANYLRTDYLPLPGKTDIAYQVFIANAEMATWAVFDGDKKWLASSDDAGGTDYWHKSPTGADQMMGWKHGALSVGDLVASYPTAAYLVLSTCVNPSYAHIVDETETDFGWGTDTAYITLA